MRARQTAVATLFPATLSVDPDLCDLIRRNIWGKMNGGAPRAGPGGVAGYTQAMLEATAETMVTLGLRDAGYGAEPPQPSWDGPLGLPLLALLQRPRSVPIQCRCRQGDTAAFGASYCSPPRTASHCLALPLTPPLTASRCILVTATQVRLHEPGLRLDERAPGCDGAACEHVGVPEHDRPHRQGPQPWDEVWDVRGRAPRENPDRPIHTTPPLAVVFLVFVFPFPPSFAPY